MSLKRKIIAQLRSDIAYEKFEGITTRHQCDCGRSWTRRGTCHVCLSELLEQLEANENHHDLQGNRSREIWNSYVAWNERNPNV